MLPAEYRRQRRKKAGLIGAELIPFLIAQNTGMTLKEISELPAPEFMAWAQFVETGPSIDKIPSLLAILLSTLGGMFASEGARPTPADFAPWLRVGGADTGKKDAARAAMKRLFAENVDVAAVEAKYADA